MIEIFMDVLFILFSAIVLVVGLALAVIIWQMPPDIVEKAQTWNEYRTRRRRHLEAFKKAP